MKTISVILLLIVEFACGYYFGTQDTKKTVKTNLEKAAINRDTIAVTVYGKVYYWTPMQSDSTLKK